MATWNILTEIEGALKSVTEKEVIKLLLKNRGYTKEADIADFLQPDLTKINTKTLGLNKKQLQKAFLRIQQAKLKKEKVIVYTDYDVDGISSGAIVWETLYYLGLDVLPYVPHREKEGYGLSHIGIERIKKDYQAKLIITVDHGITAFEKIRYAKKLGIDIIIIDHHTLPERLPVVDSIIHTTQVCATAIAWFFSNYIKEKFSANSSNSSNKVNFEDNLELVCLATVADLIPLRKINRTLVTFGLKKLAKTERIGLQTLIKELGINFEEIDTYTLSHLIAPRINALGRLSHAMDALRLLCTRDLERAIKLARVLNQANKDRQRLTEESFNIALSLAKSELLKEGNNKKIIIISHESFQEGVIGLLAARLTEKYHLPVIVISRKKDYSKASARSVKGINIVELLRKAKSLLVDVGGHPMAAGFTVETIKIEQLKKTLQELFPEIQQNNSLDKIIDVDLELKLSDLNITLYNSILKLSPFGVGNREPVFLSKNLKVIGAKLIGSDKKHLKLYLQSGVRPDFEQIEAVGFYLGHLYSQISFNQNIEAVYSLGVNKWNGRTLLQLNLKDVKMANN